MKNEKLTGFLKSNPNSNKAQITEATGLNGLVLHNLLKKLQTDGEVTKEGDGSEATYSLAEGKAEQTVVDEQAQVSDQPQSPTIVDGQETKEEQQPSAVVESTKKQLAGRDNSKYTFEGNEYGKGKLVVAVISKYVSLNPSTTYKQLKEMFPDTLMKRFGVFEEIGKAKEISGNRDRYFTKPEHVIKLGDKKVVVCSQWTAGLIVNFLSVVKTLGYKVK